MSAFGHSSGGEVFWPCTGGPMPVAPGHSVVSILYSSMVGHATLKKGVHELSARSRPSAVEHCSSCRRVAVCPEGVWGACAPTTRQLAKPVIHASILDMA